MLQAIQSTSCGSQIDHNPCDLNCSAPPPTSPSATANPKVQNALNVFREILLLSNTTWQIMCLPVLSEVRHMKDEEHACWTDLHA